MRDVGVYSIARAMPRMSWHPRNLYNLWQRSVNPRVKNTSVFTTSEKTLFQQRWKSKALVRAYHGDYIPEKIFKKWYVPDGLPNVRPRKGVRGGDEGLLESYAGRKVREDEEYEEDEIKYEMAPVGSLMFSEVERRIDTVVFRGCFAHSIYEARRLVVHGNVLLNGKRHQNANTRLKPGDMIAVSPKAVRFLQPPEKLDPTYTDDPNSSLPTPTTAAERLTPFHLPPYASPFLFIPAYLEPNFATCSLIYVRHPTARPGYSEIPSPYDADGEIVRFAWEWYSRRRPRVRSVTRLRRMPEDRTYDPESRDEREKERREQEVVRRKEEARRGGMILTEPPRK
ncbi:nam9 protein [Lentinula edodes]|nr:nam9 protein [Lentinula edodes]